MKVLISSPSSARVIIQYGIKSWPIWECEPSKFDWNYDDKEICLVIEGEATISTQKNENFKEKKTRNIGSLFYFSKLHLCRLYRL